MGSHFAAMFVGEKRKKPYNSVERARASTGFQPLAKIMAQTDATPSKGPGGMGTMIADNSDVDHVNFVGSNFANTVANTMHGLHAVTHHRIVLPHGHYGFGILRYELAAPKQNVGAICRFFDKRRAVCAEVCLFLALKVVIAQKLDKLVDLINRLLDVVQPVLKLSSLYSAEFAGQLKFLIEKRRCKSRLHRPCGSVQDPTKVLCRKNAFGAPHSVCPMPPSFLLASIAVAVEQGVNSLGSRDKTRCLNWLANWHRNLSTIVSELVRTPSALEQAG